MVKKVIRKRGRKTTLEQYINRHIKELKFSLKQIMPTLIEAFVNIYGEEHRDFIEYKIKSMKYIFFISEKCLDSLLKNSKYKSKKNLYITRRYLEYIKKVRNTFKTVRTDNEDEFIVKSCVPKFPFPTSYYQFFEDLLNDDDPFYAINLLDDDTLAEAIGLPIFTIDLKTIIHEITHTLNIKVLASTEESLIASSLFSSVIVEELVNDYTALIVMGEYIRIGGVIPKAINRLKITNQYEDKAYIVDYLFEKFAPLILESGISGNFNLLYKLIDEKDINILIKMMEDLYNKDYIDWYLLSELVAFIAYLERTVLEKDVIGTKETLKKAEEYGLKLRRFKKDELCKK